MYNGCKYRNNPRTISKFINIDSNVYELNKNCIVLNHGGLRVLNDEKIDYIGNYSKERVENFIKFSIEESTKGRSGIYGGSIRLSHAFDEKYSKLNEILKKLEDKDDIKLVVWKESGLITKRLREGKFNSFDIIENLIKKDENIFFFRNIRNPIDCAISKLKGKKLYKYLDIDLDDNLTDIEKLYLILKWIIDDIIWFIKLQRKYPEKFFYFHQNELKPLYKYIKLDIIHYFSQFFNKFYLKFGLIGKYFYIFCFKINSNLGLIGKQISRLFIVLASKLGIIGRLKKKVPFK